MIPRTTRYSLPFVALAVLTSGAKAQEFAPGETAVSRATRFFQQNNTPTPQDTIQAPQQSGLGGDAALVGTWQMRRNEGSSTPGVGSVVAETTLTWTFHRDGTMTAKTSSWVSAGVGGASQIARPKAHTLRGTWSSRLVTVGNQQKRLLEVKTEGNAVERFYYNRFTHSDGREYFSLRVNPSQQKASSFFRRIR